MTLIKPAFYSDIPLIRELTFNVWPQTYSSIISKEQIDFMLEMMYSETSLEKQMNDGAEFIIVYDNEIPVGFASYQPMKPGIYKLHKLYVLSSQQGKGTGRFMIKYIIKKIAQPPCSYKSTDIIKQKIFTINSGLPLLKKPILILATGFS
jgi:diamine N-acetyltransferase